VSSTQPARVSSRDNALLKALRRLQDSTAYRREGRVWLEGDHLCRAALARGWQPQQVVCAESAWPAAMAAAGIPADPARTVLVADELWAGISALESPARMGFVVALPAPGPLDAQAPSVVLDRVQDAGNAGSILRSAAAFGFTQVLALKGTAALWSPKVLRAGMGAHFGLRLVEGLAPADLAALAVPLVLTSSHQGLALQATALPWPCAWAFGHEGQGVGPELARQAAQGTGGSLAVRIEQPGGEESLNVAAAAAICLHASASQRL